MGGLENLASKEAGGRGAGEEYRELQTMIDGKNWVWPKGEGFFFSYRVYDKVPRWEDEQKRVREPLPSAIPHAPCRHQQRKLEPEETNCLVCSLHCCGLDWLTASFIINEVYRSLVKKPALYNLKRTTCQYLEKKRIKVSITWHILKFWADIHSWLNYDKSPHPSPVYEISFSLFKCHSFGASFPALNKTVLGGCLKLCQYVKTKQNKQKPNCHLICKDSRRWRLNLNCSSFYPWTPARWFRHSKCSVNICWVDKNAYMNWMSQWKPGMSII